MKNRNIFLAVTTFFVVAVLFYPLFMFGKLPFPGDLLISEYAPWKYSSYLGYNPGSYPNKAQYFDVALQIYPWRSLSVEMMQKYELPLWNPYNFAGAPLLANIQSAPFYPFNIAYLVFPKEYAWSFLVIIQPVIAFWGMYLLGRHYGLRRAPSVFSSFAYGLCLYMAVFLEYNTIGHVIALLPWSIFALENVFRTKKMRFVLIFVLSLVLSFLAGHLQVSFVTFGFIFVYAVFRAIAQRERDTAALVFLSFLAALCLSAPALLPAFELIENSARISQDYEFLVAKLLMQPYQLVMLFAPDIFGNPATRNFLPDETYPTKAAFIGILPLFFSAVGALGLRKNKTVLFFVFTALVCLLFLTRNPISELFFSFQIPLISTSSPSNMWFIFSFSASILAGFGMQRFLKGESFLKEFLVFCALVILFVLASFLFQRENIYLKQLVIPTFILLFFIASLIFIKRFKKARLFICLAIIVLTFFELAYLWHKFNPFSPLGTFYPRSDVVTFLQGSSQNERFLGIGHGAISPNLHTKLNLFSPEGYDPLYPRSYGEFIYSYEDGALLEDFSAGSRSNASLGNIFGDGDLMKNEDRLKIIDALSVKFLLDRVENGNTENSFPPERFRRVYDKDGWIVYENLFSLPRAYLVDEVVVSGKKNFGEIFFSSDFDPMTSVILEKKIDLPEGNLESKVEPASYTQNKAEFRVDTTKDALFVLTDSYYPGWKVYVDGVEQKILRANHAFRGVFVPKGKHQIIFVYSPESFIYGVYVSIMGVVLVIGVGIYLRRYV